ncbi:MAG: hypothetical protein JXQ26_02140 [Tissierellales bacterium]|nr:hypothetical protein [Tissierellales bacterium]
MRKLLIGTGNKARLAYVQGILEDLNLELVDLNDVNIDFRVEENGETPEENSLEKALGYHRISGLPTLSIDTGLYLDRFPKDRQPGLYVKRLGDDDAEASDEEMLDYYRAEIEACGGSSDGYWEIGMALVYSEHEVYSTIYRRNTTFTSVKSEAYTEHEPLNSIQLDLRTGKYVSELTVKEKIESQRDLADYIKAFVKSKE